MPGTVEFMEDAAPLLDKLISHRTGTKHNVCAVVIPSADSVELLDLHLSCLEEQDTDKFDVIIIGKAPAKDHGRLNMLLYSENYPLGSSGGFGVGQVLAYSLGYEYVINADVDCTPVSKNLVCTLVRKANETGKIVLPHSASFENGKMDQFGGYVLNQYGIASRKMLEAEGFLYFRLFKGGEDYDIGERCKMNGGFVFEDSLVVSHKNRIFDYIALLKFRGNKYIYYKRSLVFVSLLLSGYSLKSGRLPKSLKYAVQAWWELVKTQLFYFKFPDITMPVYRAFLMDLGEPIGNRSTELKKLVESPGMEGRRMVVGRGNEKNCIYFDSSSRGIAKKVDELRGLAEAALSKCDFIEVDKTFLDNYGWEVPLLLCAKPIKYTDGQIYRGGFGTLEMLTNIAVAFFVGIAAMLALPFGIFKASTMEYPIKKGNLAENLAEFLAYVEKIGRNA